MILLQLLFRMGYRESDKTNITVRGSGRTTVVISGNSENSENEPIRVIVNRTERIKNPENKMLSFWTIPIELCEFFYACEKHYFQTVEGSTANRTCLFTFNSFFSVHTSNGIARAFTPDAFPDSKNCSFCEFNTRGPVFFTFSGNFHIDQRSPGSKTDKSTCTVKHLYGDDVMQVRKIRCTSFNRDVVESTGLISGVILSYAAVYILLKRKKIL